MDVTRARSWRRALPAPERKESVDANSRLMALMAVGLMVVLVGMLLAAVLRPNVPIQLTGIVLALVGLGAIGYAIGVRLTRI